MAGTAAAAQRKALPLPLRRHPAGGSHRRPARPAGACHRRGRARSPPARRRRSFQRRRRSLPSGGDHDGAHGPALSLRVGPPRLPAWPPWKPGAAKPRAGPRGGEMGERAVGGPRAIARPPHPACRPPVGRRAAGVAAECARGSCSSPLSEAPVCVICGRLRRCLLCLRLGGVGGGGRRTRVATEIGCWRTPTRRCRRPARDCGPRPRRAALPSAPTWAPALPRALTADAGSHGVAAAAAPAAARPAVTVDVACAPRRGPLAPIFRWAGRQRRRRP